MSWNPVRAHSKPVLTFNGVNQFLKARVAETIDYNTAFTIRFWIKPEAPVSTSFIWSNEAASTAKGIRIQLTSALKVGILLTNDFFTARVQVTSDVALTATEWQLVEIISTGAGNAAGISFKINTVTVADTDDVDQDISAGITSTELPRIGTRPAEDSGFFEGELADFEIDKSSDPSHLEIYESAGIILLDSEKNNNHTIEGAEWLLGQSGCNDTLDSNPTETGIPQSVNEELNIFPFLQNYLYTLGIQLQANVLPVGSANRKLEITYYLPYYTTQNGIAYLYNRDISFLCSSNALEFRIKTNIWSRTLKSQSGLLSIGKNVITFELPEGLTTVGDIIVTVNGVTAIFPTTYDSETIATSNLISLFVRNGGGASDAITGSSLFRFRAWTGAGNNTLIGDWNIYSNRNYYDTSGNNQPNLVVTGDPSLGFVDRYILEDLSNPGFDIFGNAIQKSIKIGGVQKKWNIYSQTYFETIDTLSVNEFVAMIILDGSALSSLLNAILFDARDADNDGLLMWLNASGYPEIQYNTQDVAASAVLADALQLLTFWVTDTDIKIRINGVEMATAAKTGGTISTTSFLTLFAESFGTKSNYFEGQATEPLIIPSNLTLSQVQAFENDYLTEYGI